MIKPSKDFSETLYSLFLKIATPEELESDCINTKTKFAILDYFIEQEYKFGKCKSIDTLKSVYSKYDSELRTLGLHFKDWQTNYSPKILDTLNGYRTVL